MRYYTCVICRYTHVVYCIVHNAQAAVKTRARKKTTRCAKRDADTRDNNILTSRAHYPAVYDTASCAAADADVKTDVISTRVWRTFRGVQIALRVLKLFTRWRRIIYDITYRSHATRALDGPRVRGVVSRTSIIRDVAKFKKKHTYSRWRHAGPHRFDGFSDPVRTEWLCLRCTTCYRVFECSKIRSKCSFRIFSHVRNF